MEDLAYIHLVWNGETARAAEVDEMAVPEHSHLAPGFTSGQAITAEIQPVIEGDRDYADFPGFDSNLYPTIYF
ncbi:MAG: hypothetical protein K6T90_19660 [Leptolyngbyaceae cyanobacterium HOT.MB2.61]|jgi:hypothetical protein|nr:hypothetical protein [Leptolyngbyaceae cyanobacterium HOT.MB2.61]